MCSYKPWQPITGGQPDESTLHQLYIVQIWWQVDNLDGALASSHCRYSWTQTAARKRKPYRGLSKAADFVQTDACGKCSSKQLLTDSQIFRPDKAVLYMQLRLDCCKTQQAVQAPQRPHMTDSSIACGM